MYKKIIIFCLIVGCAWFGIWYMLNNDQNTISEHNTNETLYQTERQDDLVLVNDLIKAEKGVSKIDTTQSEEIISEYNEVTFEEILYPEEYDFKSVDAGEVYEKAGTKIKADFSYMIDKKIGDEVSINFLGETITGIILEIETDNGPDNIKFYDYRIDTNNSILPGGAIPERINITMFVQNTNVISVFGEYKNLSSNGMFTLKNGIGYFATKEDYGKIAKDVIKLN